MCKFEEKSRIKCWEEKNISVEDASAGPIFFHDSQNKLKNLPGGERCCRVMKNRCLFLLFFANCHTEGPDLSYSVFSVCPFFVASGFVLSILSYFPLLSPSTVSHAKDPLRLFFPSASPFLP